MDEDCKKLMRIAEANGWQRIRSKSGHLHYIHPTKKGRVTIPLRNVKRNIIKSVLNQICVGGSVSDFRNGRIPQNKPF